MFEADAVFDTIRLKQKISASLSGKKDFLQKPSDEKDQQVGWTMVDPGIKIGDEVLIKDGDKYETVDKVLCYLIKGS